MLPKILGSILVHIDFISSGPISMPDIILAEQASADDPKEGKVVFHTDIT